MWDLYQIILLWQFIIMISILFFSFENFQDAIYINNREGGVFLLHSWAIVLEAAEYAFYDRVPQSRHKIAN